jgi:choline dehydrogenase-like flavoprotein
MGFQHGGADYYVAGKKEVRKHSILDLWHDTTTLLTQLHQGTDKSGPVVGAGILSLGPLDLTKMVSTMHALNADSPVAGAEAVGRFGKFFMGELWATYCRI